MSPSGHIKLNLISSIGLLMLSLLWSNVRSSPRTPGHTPQLGSVPVPFVLLYAACQFLDVVIVLFFCLLYPPSLCQGLPIPYGFSPCAIPFLCRTQILDGWDLLLSSVVPNASSQRNRKKDGLSLQRTPIFPIRACSSFYIMLSLQASPFYCTEDHQLNTKVICFPTEVTSILVPRKDKFMFVQIILISAKFLTGALGWFPSASCKIKEASQTSYELNRNSIIAQCDALYPENINK